MKRKFLISAAAAALLAVTASPAMADHSRLAVSVAYGPTVVHYADRDGWYFDGHRYLRFDRRYDDYRSYRRSKARKNHRNRHRRFRHRHYYARDWCPIGRPHWH